MINNWKNVLIIIENYSIARHLYDVIIKTSVTSVICLYNYYFLHLFDNN